MFDVQTNKINNVCHCTIQTISTLQPFHYLVILMLQDTIAHLPLASTLSSSVAAVNKLSPAR